MNLLETVDVILLQRILNTPKTTPNEMLYLELGYIPLRNLIQQRRLAFLFYIKHEDQNALVNRFFETQLSKRTKTTVLKDIEELNLNVNIEDIKKMKQIYV